MGIDSAASKIPILIPHMTYMCAQKLKLHTLLGNIMTGKMMTGKIIDWGKYGGISGNPPHFPGDDS